VLPLAAFVQPAQVEGLALLGLVRRIFHDTRSSEMAQARVLPRRLQPTHAPTPPSTSRSYHIFRYPILFFLLFIIYAEFSCYVLTRQVVNVFEYVVAWTGHKRVLRRQMRRAGTWREWVAAAEEMDKYLGFQAWKAVSGRCLSRLARESRDSMISG
jgi:hypothetical protein